MKQQMLALSLGVGALLLATQHAFAQSQPNCAPHDLVAQRLSEKYGETLQSIGLSPQSGLVETYASGSTGTWTITVTTPQGTTCIVASGQAFETHAAREVPKGEGA